MPHRQGTCPVAPSPRGSEADRLLPAVGLHEEPEERAVLRGVMFADATTAAVSLT